MSLLIPWLICLLFVVVAAGIFADSRWTERQVDKEWLAIRDERAAMKVREANAQEIVANAKQLVESYRTQLIKAEERNDDLVVQNLELNERLLKLRAGR